MKRYKSFHRQSVRREKRAPQFTDVYPAKPMRSGGIFSSVKDDYNRQCGEQKRQPGATAHELMLCGKRIIVDHGMSFDIDPKTRVRSEFGPACNFFMGQDVACILLTHAHADHAGDFVPLAQEHPEAEVYISGDALRAVRLLSNESVNIAIRNIPDDADMEKAMNDLIFDKQDIADFMARPLNIVYRPWWARPWPGWKIGFFPSGHDVGAMSVWIVPPTGPVVYLTGDVCSHDQSIATWRCKEDGQPVEFRGVMLPPAEWLEQGGIFGRKVVMITEATKGADIPQKSWAEIESDFISSLRAVEKRDGQVLLSVFKKNRAANLITILVNAGIVPHLAPSLRWMLKIDLPEIDQLEKDGKVVFLCEKKGSQEEAIRHGRLVAQGKDPCGHKFSPLIATAAMMDNGLSPVFAEEILFKPENAVFFTGHIFPDTIAADLMAGAKQVTLNLGADRGTVTTEVSCEIRKFGFTSHDYQPALVERVWRLRPDKLIVHHCSDAAYDAFVAALAAKFSADPEHPSLPEIVRGEHMRKIALTD